MKQLLTILIFIFALPLSDVFAQHNEPLPNAVLKMDAGYSIKGNKVTAIDKTTMSTKNTSIPSSQAVQTAITAAIATAVNAAQDSATVSSTGYYKIDPPSTELWSGITSLDTNTIHYGSLVKTGILSTLPYKNKKIFIDNLVKTGNGDYGYFGNANYDLHINNYIGDAKGLLINREAGTASYNVNIDVNKFLIDSLNTTTIGTGAFYIRDIINHRIFINCNLLEDQFWGRVVYSPGYTIDNSNVDFRFGNIRQNISWINAQNATYKNNSYATIEVNNTLNNTIYTITIDNAQIQDQLIRFTGALTNNSTLKIIVKNATKKWNSLIAVDKPMIYISGSTDATSKIIIEGDYQTDNGPVVEVASNANILYKGSFITTSTTQGVIKLSTSAANVKLQGLLKTGHTESITAAGAYSISVLPGSAANKAVGATVTQVGGTITVNAGY